MLDAFMEEEHAGKQTKMDPWCIFTEGLFGIKPTGLSGGISHTGSQRAWLDGGTAKKVSQMISVPIAGTYTLSGWVASISTGGVFGIKVNNAVIASVNIPNNTTYNLQTMSNISLNVGDSVEVYVTGATTNWVNFDDVTLSK
ncbi:hypothetical protein GC098_10750 [Paenibacillus sp. LMG 31458]|uniref:CBM6 domain-containing protein n=1 Tax=Paenibacillus phytorum TaxID=2654977 RepID=A0ABX1XTN6_9BACL|nr:hypothetical protein [Paenibacillus phytorum]NOU71892.1 hypothetical protein [Paenibacillus phytorum]